MENDKSVSGIEFGDYLKCLREVLGLSLQELGRRSNVTAGYINRIERKETTAGNQVMIPSPQILRHLAPHLKTSYHDLMRAAGHLEDVIEKPDLYNLLLSGQVKIEGVEVTDLDLAKKLVQHIKAAISLAESWNEMKNNNK